MRQLCGVGKSPSSSITEIASQRHITDCATEELKLDGYRALAIKSSGKVSLRSRNDNDFNSRYPGIVNALAPMPDDTVIDGEVVALDKNGRPSFNALQNYGSASSPLHFFIFDLLVLQGRDVMGDQLTARRQLIEQHVLPKLSDPVLFSA
ncbi:MAG TPA: hypothetical protein VK846_18190 [Candidatus Limnocylindria bacterium]|nr:hypothetical protein [Candidatus Limnocylindria bacterium]